MPAFLDVFFSSKNLFLKFYTIINILYIYNGVTKFHIEWTNKSTKFRNSIEKSRILT